MSTTLPYLSKYGNRSSAVVPKIHTQTRSNTKPINFIPTKILKEREREKEWLTEGDVENEERVGVGDVRRACSSEVRHCYRERERVVNELDWIRLGLGFVCFGKPGYEDRTFIYRY